MIPSFQPDRLAELRAQDRWAAAQVAPDRSPDDSRNHEGEVMSSHSGQPTVTWQNQHNGAAAPAEDRGRPGDSILGPGTSQIPQ